MNIRPEPSPAEWEVMRVIWTLEEPTSRTISQILKDTMDWENATTKTLLGRLVKKGYLKTQRQGNRFIYEATIDEQTGANTRLSDLASTFCNKSKGKAIAHLISQLDLSFEDRDLLLDTISNKTFNDQLNCNCLSACQCATGQCTCGHSTKEK